MKTLLWIVVCTVWMSAAAIAAPGPVSFSCDPSLTVSENGQIVAVGPLVTLSQVRTRRSLVLKEPGYRDESLTLTWIPILEKWQMSDGQFMVEGQEIHLRPVSDSSSSRIPVALAILGAMVCGAAVVRKRPGRRIVAAGGGEYSLIRTLGSGVSGTVFEARRRTDGSHWAIKVLRQASWDGFEREAAIWARLHHPGIVRLHSWGHWGDCPYLVMELVEGETLRASLGRGPISTDEALRFVGELLAALKSAHAVGVIHRDLKPENIMITPSRRLRIMDLGSARTEVTFQGSVQGTPRYMAPEQFQGVTTPSVDVYAVGTMAYEMLTGLRPYEQGSMWELRTAKMTMAPRSLQELRPDVPDAVTAAIELMMAPRPDVRPKNATEALTLLREAIECHTSVAA